VTSSELSMGQWIKSGEPMDSLILDNGGCPESSPESNIGKWRVLGELKRVEYENGGCREISWRAEYATMVSVRRAHWS
jgi:hypothetical protein